MHYLQRMAALFFFVAAGLAAAAAVIVLPRLPAETLADEAAGGLRVDEQAETSDLPPPIALLAGASGATQEADAAPPTAERCGPIIHAVERSHGSSRRSAETVPQAPLRPRAVFMDEVYVSPQPPPRRLAAAAPLAEQPAASLDAATAWPEYDAQKLPQILSPTGEDDAAREPPRTAPPWAKRLLAPLPRAAVPVVERARQGAPVVPAQALFPDEGDDKLDIAIPDTDIREVLELLSKAGNLNILASRNVSGQVKASLTGVSVDTALAAILRSTGYVARREGDFIYVGTPQDFLAMDHAVDRVGTRVYRPNYVTAAELQTLVAPMLTPAIGTVSVSSAAEVGIGADTNSAGGNNFAGAEVVLVRDYEGVLAQIDQVFDEVDRRPLQVSIEAMILSVKLSDELAVGVDWELLRRREHIRMVFGSPLDNLANVDVSANNGLKVGFLDTSLSSFLDTLEKIGETHVIASPRLMCLNKQRAEIHIGEQRGYVSTTVTETAATQAVEFLEVGTQLRLRPFISNDGMVRLEIHPELSTGTVDVTETFTLPRKVVTQVTTNVMVRDGATLVIGGLLREDINTDTTQLPLLGSLPWLGPAFRRKTESTVRDEIIVLVTPRIVWEPRFNCEGEYAACEFHQQHAIMADKMSHISRVYYGRRYRRLAKAAWVAGDAKSALRYANMSIHFNRLDREAIQLRSEIVARSPYGDKTVDSHLREGVVPWLHPLAGHKLDHWVLDELHGPHTHIGQEPAPVHPQGQTGYRNDIFVPVLPHVQGEAVEPPPAPLPSAPAAASGR